MTVTVGIWDAVAWALSFVVLGMIITQLLCAGRASKEWKRGYDRGLKFGHMDGRAEATLEFLRRDIARMKAQRPDIFGPDGDEDESDDVGSN